jgi:CrcB protein
MINQQLRHETRELALVGAGAIPGALLRWQLEGAGVNLIGGLKGQIEADIVANLLGCLLIGLLLSTPNATRRLVLWGVIGFCGSLTTFSSWMLALVRALDRGEPTAALGVLLFSLIGGLVMVRLGRTLGRRSN